MRLFLWLRGLAASALLAAMAGGLIGVFLDPQLIRAFHGWPTLWQDMGPGLFLPVWIASSAGAGARLLRGEVTSPVLAILAGLGAGSSAPTLYRQLFGKPAFTVGILSGSMAGPLVLAFLGGLGGFFWYAGVAKRL